MINNKRLQQKINDKPGIEKDTKKYNEKGIIFNIHIKIHNLNCLGNKTSLVY